MSILSLNCGSSSVKYQLYDWDQQKVLAKGQVDRIGLPDSNIAHKYSEQKVEKKEVCPDHKGAIKIILHFLLDEAKIIKSLDDVSGVGHRVVHGGDKFSGSVLIDRAVLKAIEDNSELAPLHNPPNIQGIISAQEIMPQIPQVAIFDTAFHQTIPEHAYTYGLELELREKYGIRRYGFHGSSHRYVTEKAQMFLKNEKCRLITIHIGNGGSLAAVKNGRSLDTSMGMTPLQGIVMGTRSGDFDPGVFPYLLEKSGESINEVYSRLNKKSGMLGLSGISSDQRDIERAAQNGDKRSQLALDIQAYSIKKYIGAYLTVLNGVDALVFTGGIGENSDLLRQKVCADLENLGIVIDDQKNKNCQKTKEGFDVAADNSLTKILVIPTDEEYIIARDVIDIINK